MESDLEFENSFANLKIMGYWYVLIGHYAGENFAHTEMYQPHQYETAYRQACRWKQEVGYEDVKIMKYATKDEAELRMHQIEKLGW